MYGEASLRCQQRNNDSLLTKEICYADEANANTRDFQFESGAYVNAAGAFIGPPSGN